MPDLKELLGEDLYNQVTEKAGNDHKIALVSDGNWFPKAKFDEVNNAKKTLETTIQDRDNQLQELQKSAGDNKELKETIERLQADNKTAKENFESEAKALKLDTAVKLALSGKVHDPDIVTGLLDKRKLELDDNGSIKTGLDDQLKSLQESKGFLFVPEKSSNPSFKGFTPFDGKPGGDEGGGNSNNIGKQLAAHNKQVGADMQKAQANYFGNGGQS